MQALFAFCVGLTGDRPAANDLVQDTFVRAWERLATFRGESTFGTWLHRVAVNTFLSEARANRRRGMRVVLEADLGALDDADVAGHAPPHDTASLHRLDLEAALHRLPPGARLVFVMHDLAGYRHAEIAQHLGIAEGTCKAHLFRARRLLRGMLER